MKNLRSIKIVALALSVCLLIIASGCKKEGSNPNNIDVGNVPHKEVPDTFQGDFAWTIVSSSGYDDQWGGSYSALSYGTQAHLNKNGTGTWVFRYDITYATGTHKSVHIDSDVAYEITKIDESHANFTIHFIRGKNYEDGKFLHDLDASKIYPNGDFVWENVEYGVDEQGRTYFKPDDSSPAYVKK